MRKKPQSQVSLHAYNAYQNLLKQDDLPNVWKKSFLEKLLECCKAEKQGRYYQWHHGFVYTEQKRFEWYIKNAKKKLGKTIGEVVRSARSGNPNALCKLIGTDPTWLYDNWVREIILEKLKQGDQKFLESLGEAIACKKNKAKPFPRKENTNLLENLEKKRGVFGGPAEPLKRPKQGSPVKQLLREAIDAGVIDPDQKDMSEETFRKFLKRNNLAY